ncbi:ribosome-binding factor A [Treponema primitia ZAS-2]|uniref:Ribosome-binding factor A n=1 Tax=Treponema primitia (strain ATCC BAA-887 / DSM 12427 / ZAS-2) TaxID=545694 RepID=F5YM30_TREPZ|nr:30S ribosome-binding factor RbfA [Treponema primitia]AEF85948.1 ribosome-binding factor A [Treponema primitia ZAS-2]
MAEYRTERVGRLIQEKIGSLIVEGKVKDPRVDTFLSITRVAVSRDLSYADCYVSSYKSAGLATGVEGLQSAAGFIQSQLAAMMHIRHTPRLRFHEDQGIREGFELVQKIDSLVNTNSETPNDGQ